MIQPTLMERSCYWKEIITRTFVDSGHYSNRLSIVQDGRFIIHVKRITGNKAHAMLNSEVVPLEKVLDFLRESENELDRDVFEWFLFHIDEFI